MTLRLNLTRLIAFLAVLALPLSTFAQSINDVEGDGMAKLQVIHNAADPGAASVDVYFNGSLLLDNFGFREASGFVEVPANVEHTIVIAPPNSNSVADGIATFNVTLNPNTNYIAVASGVLDPSAFSDNPGDISTAFDLRIIAGVQTEATSNETVRLNIFHGATDAPAVDITARAETPIVLVPNAAFGQSAQINVAPGAYELDIKVAGTDIIAAAFEADLSGAGGAAVTVLASGFYNVAENQYGEQFRLIAVFADGTVAELPAKTGQIQVIHNAADPGAASVDVYVNGALALEDFAFRAATPFIALPAYLPHSFGIAAPNSESVEDAIANFSAGLSEGGAYHVVANGVLDPSSFAANPDDKSTAFNLFVLPSGRTAALSSSEVTFRVFHGATDAPGVDVRLTNGGAVLVDNAQYGDVSGYIDVPQALYTVDVTLPGDPSAVVATYDIDVNGLGGGAAFIAASGFLAPATNQNGPAFELLVVLPDGTAILAPLSTSIDETFDSPTSFELRGNYPNPFNPTTVIRYSIPVTAEVNLTVFDMLGREVAVLVNGTQNAGSYDVSFNAANLSSGVYLYRLQSGNFVQTQKMMLVK